MGSSSKPVRIGECKHTLNRSKRQKIFEDSKDRISSLPNRVLCHILSFLPTKYAVGTSILSTRWHNLWISLPNLDFDDELLHHEERLEREHFADFVDTVLLQHHGFYIKRFRLKCGQSCYYPRVKRWIYDALGRNVQELDLCISLMQAKVLPRGLFTCETLISLKLGTNFVLNLPHSATFPSLKTLHLKSIKFSDDESFRNLISGCLVLEDLILWECELKDIHLINISAPALKYLTIECASMCESMTEFCKYEIVINAPSLKYLKLIDYVAEGYSLKNLHSLIEACIYVDISSEQLKERSHAYGKNVLELVRGISNAKILHLSGYCMEALELYSCEIPTLHRATHVDLTMSKMIGWRLLPELLHSCPNLVALNMGQGLFFSKDCVFDWQPTESVPLCLLVRLKEIKIWAFQGRNDELNVVQYLLKNAKVLSKLIIVTNLSKDEELSLSKTLLKYSRGSEACEVVFS